MADLVVGLFFFAVLSLEHEANHANLPSLVKRPPPLTFYPRHTHRPTNVLVLSTATITGCVGKTVALKMSAF